MNGGAESARQKKKLITISVLKEKPRLQIAYFTLLS